MAQRLTASGRSIQGFKMRLLPGFAEEYERRHNELWPEMADMLHEYGGHNYSIFIDAETDTLFGYIEVDDPERYAQSAATEVCQRWWAYMAGVMETNADNSPVTVDLDCAFHLD
ncbi:MAG: L-rhamnose mutarotase [Collinsella sp.]|nr:L-rhamnose mutarotase [Collinsella sp.]